MGPNRAPPLSERVVDLRHLSDDVNANEDLQTD